MSELLTNLSGYQFTRLIQNDNESVTGLLLMNLGGCLIFFFFLAFDISNFY